MKTRILIPTDGSALSLRIVPTIEQFFSPEQAELLVLQVAPAVAGQGNAQAALLHDPAINRVALDRMTVNDYQRGKHPIYANQIESNLRAEREAELLPVVQELRQHGYQVQPLVEFGEAATSILYAAQHHNADLIAMTTHGRTGIRRQIVGSVTESVLREATLPVLVLHPPPEHAAYV